MADSVLRGEENRGKRLSVGMGEAQGGRRRSPSRAAALTGWGGAIGLLRVFALRDGVVDHDRGGELV